MNNSKSAIKNDRDRYIKMYQEDLEDLGFSISDFKNSLSAIKNDRDRYIKMYQEDLEKSLAA